MDWLVVQAPSRARTVVGFIPHTKPTLIHAHRLTHLARALDEWVREGTVEPKGLCQVQIHLRHIIMTCDGTHPSSSAAPASGPANGNGNGNGSGSRKAAGSGAAKAPAPPPRKGQGAKGAGAGVSKVPTVERAVAEGMAFLGKLDAHRWFAKPVVEVWPDFKVGECAGGSVSVYHTE